MTRGPTGLRRNAPSPTAGVTSRGSAPAPASARPPPDTRSEQRRSGNSALVMSSVFVRRVAGRLELERGVLDVEVPTDAGLQRVEDLWRVTVVEAGVLDHDVCGQRR